MKKILLPVIAVSSLFILVLTGCEALNIVYGSGSITTRDFSFTDFNGIDAGSAIEVQVSRGDAYKVSISTHENIFDYLDVSQSGKTLGIHLKPGSFNNTDIKATITMPQLARFVLSGASKGNVQGFKSSNDFELRVSGASQLNINMEAGKTTGDISGASRVTGQLIAQNTQLTISGASRCELSGSAADTTLNISGASQASAQNFQLNNADVSVSGASKAVVNTNGNLSLDVTGASTLEYHGNPTLKKVNVSGASRLNQP